jgi:acetyl-CoA synthetase
MGKHIRNIQRALVYTNELPKTRSGKIIRRILKSLVRNESMGGAMTLMNPMSAERLKEK